MRFMEASKIYATLARWLETADVPNDVGEALAAMMEHAVSERDQLEKRVKELEAALALDGM